MQVESLKRVVLNMHLFQLAVQASYSHLTSPNDPFKKHQKELFSSWYADKVKDSLDKDVSIESVKIDLRTSTIKPDHFQWLIKNMAWCSHQEDVLIRGWKETGILDYEYITVINLVY